MIGTYATDREYYAAVATMLNGVRMLEKLNFSDAHLIRSNADYVCNDVNWLT